MDKKRRSTVLSEHEDNIAKLFKKIKKSTEFEIDFNMDKTAINYEKYVSLMEFLRYLETSKKLETEKKIMLDVNYSQIVESEVRETYRISVDGRSVINKYVNLLKSKHNHVVFNTLMSLASDGKSNSGATASEYLRVYKKIKVLDNTYDIPELNMRVRLADEIDISKKEMSTIKKLDYSQQGFIMFRLKQRVSVILEQTKDYILRLDLTTTKTSNMLTKIEQAIPRYEMEMEYFAITDNVQSVQSRIIDESLTLLKVIQQSNYIITRTQMGEVINEYKRLLNLGDKKIFAIEGRQPVTLEIQYVSDLFNKYAVTDKADGERHFMIICNNHVYIISNTLNIRDTGISLKDNTYDGTIFDGEYVFIQKAQRHLFMVFDCLFAKNEDMRKEANFMTRLNTAAKIINECFIFGKQKGFTPDEMKTEITNSSIVKYHITQLNKFVDTLHADIQIEKKYPLIRTKYFMPVTGLGDNEIFKYSMIVWDKFKYNEVKYPYMLDGMVYHPLNQAYVTDARTSKLSEYKWKPPENNTIDFYVQFAKHPQTGKIYDVYDNSSNDDTVKDRIYRICYLCVGRKTKEGTEIPVYFNEDKKLHIALLFLQDGVIRDKEGNIIQDNTVVEFYYNNDLEIADRFKWTPLRTRHDKTGMVQKYKVKYGNGMEVANRNWRSILTPVRIVDIKALADDNAFWGQLKEMKSKITEEMMISMAKENAYYQIKTNLAKPMRQFHNWIKSILIYTYIGPLYNGGKNCSVLDVGSGRGGDIEKFYHAHIAYCVGIEPSYDGIHNAFDGSIRRYNDERKKLPAAPRIDFVCGDFSVPLNVDDQIAVSSDKSNDNRRLIEKFFPEKNMTQFDRINFSFSFHYLPSSDKSWDNSCNNINKCLKPGGFMIITTYDAQLVIDALGAVGKYSQYYTTAGEKKLFHEIVRKFPADLDRKKIGTGVAIDVYNSLVSAEDTYITEYLVDKDFIISELDKKCNMEIIDTDTIKHQFEIHREIIRNTMTYDMNLKTRSYFSKVAEYYKQDDEINSECFKITSLNRYYVFRKREK